MGIEAESSTGAPSGLCAHFFVASDNGLAEIPQRGFPASETLKDYEKSRFNSLLLGFYAQYNFAYPQFVKGESDPVM